MTRTKVRWRMRDVRSGGTVGTLGRSARCGFTLIEVTVALAIFLVVVLALVSSYAWYYGNIQGERFRTIGQNLAQLQVEDIRGLPSSVLKIITGGTNAAGTGLGQYLPNYPTDTASDASVYDSGTIDATFRVERLGTVLGTVASASSPDSASGFANMWLPDNIELKKNTDTVDGVDTYSYSVTLFKETFPNYQKRVVITDETPGVAATSSKIFRYDVTVSWTYRGQAQSAVFTGETNDARTVQ